MSRFMSKRAGGLVGAVVLAALASLALVAYMHNVEERAYAGAETVEVFVAKSDIPAGMSGADAVRNGMIGTARSPRSLVPAGVIGSLDQVHDQVAAVTIVAGEQILATRFISPADIGAGLPIPKGSHAMSVEVEMPPGVAGFITQGASVGIIAHVETGSGTTGEPTARFVLQDITVLAVGQRVATAPGQGNAPPVLTDKVMLTLAVSPLQAEKLAYALFEGDIYFTLMPSDAESVPTPGRTRGNEFR